MWNRSELKDRCKAVMKRSYGKMFIVAFLAFILCGEFSGNTAEHASNLVRNHEEITVSFGTFTYRYPISVLYDHVFNNGLLVIFVILTIILGILAIFYGIFVANPLKCGSKRFFIQNIDEEQQVSVLFSVFSTHYLNIVKIMFIKNLKIFLWTLLFVIPGIVKAYEYQMIPYLLAEDPSMSSEEAFARSRQMTNNQKFDMFVLDLSFFGWWILGSFLIIGRIFVNPYYEGVLAELYVELKTRCYDTSYE